MAIENTGTPARQPARLADQGHFFVGGRYVTTAAGQILAGQMYVQYQIPENRTQPYPVVLWHGGGQTGSSFLGTPDGRPGWQSHFLERGYAVYIVDQPARGRSGFFAEIYGETRQPDAQSMSARFTAPALAQRYPQAHLHTQWPGEGVAGDPVFDQFFASQVEDIADFAVIERLNRDAGLQLLENIGPAILLTHSQSGPIGWELADAVPHLVKAILAVEPNGPPFHDVTAVGAPDWSEDGALSRAWGITRLPLTYAPPVPGDAGGLAMAREERPEGEGLACCWLQQEPARQLPHLRDVRILIVVGEASYHAPYDHCTSRFLAQAGVEHDFVRLADVGIPGNGHMMMLESNNREIAAFLADWAKRQVGS